MVPGCGFSSRTCFRRILARFSQGKLTLEVLRDFAVFRRSFPTTSPSSWKCYPIIGSQKVLKENIHIFTVSTLPADGLAKSGARISVGILKIKFRFRIWENYHLKGQTSEEIPIRFGSRKFAPHMHKKHSENIIYIYARLYRQNFLRSPDIDLRGIQYIWNDILY